MTSKARAALSLLCLLLADCGAAVMPSAERRYFGAPRDGIAFDYPDTLHLQSRDNGPDGIPRLAVVMVENQPLNVAWLAGEVTEAMEGPPLIALDVYNNPGRLDPAGWIAQSTNWIISDKPRESVRVGGQPGLVFYWDGLYAGKSAVVCPAYLCYVFSVSWIDPQDPLGRAFPDLLASVILGPPGDGIGQKQDIDGSNR